MHSMPHQRPAARATGACFALALTTLLGACTSPGPTPATMQDVARVAVDGGPDVAGDTALDTAPDAATPDASATIVLAPPEVSIPTGGGDARDAVLEDVDALGY